jgi:hypothetical protein
MKSVYDELAEKLLKDPSVTKRVGPRQDIGILLFAYRDAINELWKSAELRVGRDGIGNGDAGVDERLREAVERLRPLFGPRDEPRSAAS